MVRYPQALVFMVWSSATGRTDGQRYYRLDGSRLSPTFGDENHHFWFRGAEVCPVSSWDDGLRDVFAAAKSDLSSFLKDRMYTVGGENFHYSLGDPLWCR